MIHTYFENQSVWINLALFLSLAIGSFAVKFGERVDFARVVYVVLMFLIFLVPYPLYRELSTAGGNLAALFIGWLVSLLVPFTVTNIRKVFLVICAVAIVPIPLVFLMSR